MKKLLLSMALAISSLSAMAQFNGTGTFIFSGTSFPASVPATLTDNGNGTYTLNLSSIQPGALPSVIFSNVPGTKSGSAVTLTTPVTSIIDFTGTTYNTYFGLTTESITLNSATFDGTTLTFDATTQDINIAGMGDAGIMEFKFTGTGTISGIANAPTVDNTKPIATYNINGQRVNNDTQAKGIYIVKQADGKTVKVIK